MLHRAQTRRGGHHGAAMEELFTETALVHGVAGFTAKLGRQATVKLWRTQKDQREWINSLLGKGSRPPKRAKRLCTLGLSRQALVDNRWSTATSEEFQRVLLEKGVHSRPLRSRQAGWCSIVLREIVYN